MHRRCEKNFAQADAVSVSMQSACCEVLCMASQETDSCVIALSAAPLQVLALHARQHLCSLARSAAPLPKFQLLARSAAPLQLLAPAFAPFPRHLRLFEI